MRRLIRAVVMVAGCLALSSGFRVVSAEQGSSMSNWLTIRCNADGSYDCDPEVNCREAPYNGIGCCEQP